MKLEEIQKDNLISGIEQSGPVRIIAVEGAGENAVSVVMKPILKKINTSC